MSSAGALFQFVMDKILSGIGNNYSYLDDILLITITEDKMTTLVEKVLKQLGKYGVKVNSSEIKFFKRNLVFLGNFLEQSGIVPARY